MFVVLVQISLQEVARYIREALPEEMKAKVPSKAGGAGRTFVDSFWPWLAMSSKRKMWGQEPLRYE